MPKSSGAGTNLKVRGVRTARAPDNFFWSSPSTIFALQAQLVVLISTFAMVSTVWSVSCLLFYSRCPSAQPFVKVGARAPPPVPIWSRCQIPIMPMSDDYTTPNLSHSRYAELICLNLLLQTTDGSASQECFNSVSSVSPTLVRASMLAWLSTSSDTMDVWPHLLATCSGEMSFYTHIVTALSRHTNSAKR